MTAEERAKRIAAWGWAASLLGVEAGPDRILGLVEVTAKIRIDRLKPALEAVIKSEPAGFLPSPGAVIAAANRLAERMPDKQIGAGKPITEEKLRALRADLNPNDWDASTWRAFIYRMARDGAFASRAKQASAARHEWASEQVERELAGRSASMEFRINLRRQLNREAYDVHPRPNPFDGGWQMPASQTSNVDLLAQIMRQA